MVRVIAWDLDETLGRFTALKYGLNGQKVPEWESEPGVRFGIRQALEDLARADWTHVVTSYSDRPYADEVLKRANLAPYFNRVFTQENIGPVDKGGRKVAGKLYMPVAEHFGLFGDDIGKNLVVVGDLPGDQPIDTPGLVFVHQAQGFRSDAKVIKNILEILLRVGEGHILSGFKALDTRGGRVDFGEGLFGKVEHRPLRMGGEGSEVPTIYGIEDINYERVLDPLENE